MTRNELYKLVVNYSFYKKKKLILEYKPHKDFAVEELDPEFVEVLDYDSRSGFATVKDLKTKKEMKYVFNTCLHKISNRYQRKVLEILYG